MSVNPTQPLNAEQYTLDAIRLLSSTVKGTDPDAADVGIVYKSFHYMDGTTYTFETPGCPAITRACEEIIDNDYPTQLEVAKHAAIYAYYYTMHYCNEAIDTKPDEEGFLAMSKSKWYELRDIAKDYYATYLS